MAKERIKIKQPMKVRSILQKEINSICPFCDSTEVEYFEIHHIDEDPSNNEIENLLLICPTHHSKITKGDISKEIVERTKKSLPIKLQIEVASISIDHNNCSWVSYDDVKHAFYQRGNEPSPFPIICFSLINHSPKTILFTEIELKEQYIYSGLSGLPRAGILKSLSKFKMQLPGTTGKTTHRLIDEIEVPAGQAFKFQIEIYECHGGEIYSIDGKKALDFTFKFNNDIKIPSPTIFLKCKSKDEKMLLIGLE